MPEAGKMKNLYDVAVVSEEIEGHLELTLEYAEGTMSPVEAESLLDFFCTAVESLSWRLESSINKLTSTFNSSSRNSKHIIQNSATSSPSPQDEDLILQGSIILDIWQSVFSHKRSVADSSVFPSPFFDLGGDLVDAARFVFTAQQHGIRVNLDDVLKYCSLDKLVGYLS
jgi:hypothetical protein